ncbi:hypothetical protein [Catellatospora paridis]|uniref:hypothetical protein n=1 Tax=Catellatospora paridis TaxID=1617086 RepID=UPI0012D3FA18|nr:hypothetical protein [Catellatospora paridis]
MKTISAWWEWQRGWRLAVQLAAVAALLAAAYVVAGYLGWLVGQGQARIEVAIVDSDMQRPPRPELPPNPFTSPPVP